MSTMTFAERETMAWLDVLAANSTDARTREFARTAKTMLARPVMPEEPTPEALNVMFRAFREGEGSFLWPAVYRALYAHLSPPATKTVQCWHVEYLRSTDGRTWEPAIELYTSEAAARHFEHAPRRGAAQYRDISVTGPHARSVPA